jgi:O-antigen/teichoic acid export membrane protein
VYFALASGVPRFASFMLLPVFIRALSPAEYGQLSVALALSAFAVVVFGLGFEVVVFRRFFTTPVHLRQNFVASTWSFLIVTSAVMAILLSLIVAPLLSTNEVLAGSSFALSLLGAALTVSATTVPLAVLRAEDRIRDYVTVAAITAGAAISLTLVLVVVAHAGVNGWLLAMVAGNGVGLVAAMRVVPFHLPQPFDRGAVSDTLRSSIHIVPHFAALWSLQLADRVLVASLISTSAAGLYSLASNIALPMYVIVLGFGQAFMPEYARSAAEPKRLQALHSTINAQVAVVASLSLACALLLGPLVTLISNAEYDGAAPLVPWIVLGYAFLGLYAVPMNGLTLVHGRTAGLAIVSGLGAAANIGLIVLLATPYGLEAVAIATAAGYAVLLVAVLLFARWRKASLSYSWARIGAMITVAGAGYAIGASVSSGDSLIGASARAVIAFAATGLIARVAQVHGGIIRRLKLSRSGQTKT